MKSKARESERVLRWKNLPLDVFILDIFSDVFFLFSSMLQMFQRQSPGWGGREVDDLKKELFLMCAEARHTKSREYLGSETEFFSSLWSDHTHISDAHPLPPITHQPATPQPARASFLTNISRSSFFFAQLGRHRSIKHRNLFFLLCCEFPFLSHFVVCCCSQGRGCVSICVLWSCRVEAREGRRECMFHVYSTSSVEVFFPCPSQPCFFSITTEASIGIWRKNAAKFNCFFQHSRGFLGTRQFPNRRGFFFHHSASGIRRLQVMASVERILEPLLLAAHLLRLA